MIRVVVSVVLAVALLAAAQPAVQQAAEDRSETQIQAAVDDLDGAATDLARSEEAVPGGPGARRVVTVDLPREGVGAAAVDHLTVHPAGRQYSYRVEGRTERTAHGRTPVVTLDGEPLVLRGSGPHGVVLALVSVGGERRVVAAPLHRITGSDDAVADLFH